MQPWRIERGTLWSLETHHPLPLLCSANVEVSFHTAEASDITELAQVLNLPHPTPLYERLQNKRRRCFLLRANNQIVTYGWVTNGAEHVGELERHFTFPSEDAYIWDCGTVPAWRGQRCYSTLLSHLIYQLHSEGVSRIWIGASRQNQPSVKGFINAGFEWVLNLTYRRYLLLSLLWFELSDEVSPSLISAAYQALVNNHEHRLGRLAIGCKSGHQQL